MIAQRLENIGQVPCRQYAFTLAICSRTPFLHAADRPPSLVTRRSGRRDRIRRGHSLSVRKPRYLVLQIGDFRCELAHVLADGGKPVSCSVKRRGDCLRLCLERQRAHQESLQITSPQRQCGERGSDNIFGFCKSTLCSRQLPVQWPFSTRCINRPT